MAEREVVAEPVPFPEAFQRTDDASVQSQAAVLLVLGNLLRYEDRRSMDAFSRMAAPQEAEIQPEMVPEEDRERLNLPEDLWRLRTFRGARFDAGWVRESLAIFHPSFAAPWVSVSPEEARERALVAMPEIAETLYREPEPTSAAQLCEAGLSHPDELVRVAAASSYLEIGLPEQQEVPIQVLVRGTYSEDAQVCEVAATALARVVPGHPRLVELMRPQAPAEDAEPSRTSLLVHGTWARRNSWWQPGGNFHQYLKTNVDPNLYSVADRFDWSGGYSDHARDVAALDLVGWVNARGLGGLDLFTHSHGGSVAMQANRRAGLRIGRLVLLSCPVHWQKYRPDLSLVTKAVSIRVRMDLVILADGGGQRFPAGSGIQEIVLPIYFNHSISHDPATWNAHNLPQRI